MYNNNEGRVQPPPDLLCFKGGYQEVIMKNSYVSRPDRHFHYMNEEGLIIMPYKYPERYYAGASVEIEGELYLVDEPVQERLEWCYEALTEKDDIIQQMTDIIQQMNYVLEVNDINFEEFMKNQGEVNDEKETTE